MPCMMQLAIWISVCVRLADCAESCWEKGEMISFRLVSRTPTNEAAWRVIGVAFSFTRAGMTSLLMLAITLSSRRVRSWSRCSRSVRKVVLRSSSFLERISNSLFPLPQCLLDLHPLFDVQAQDFIHPRKFLRPFPDPFLQGVCEPSEALPPSVCGR